MFLSWSVLAFLIAFAVSSSVALSIIVFPRDLDILAVPSSPIIIGVLESSACGSGKIGFSGQNFLLKRFAIRRATSRCGSWSFPTGTTLPLQKRISTAWWTGYVSIPALTLFIPDFKISSFTVGLRSSSALETRVKNGTISWLASGMWEWG